MVQCHMCLTKVVRLLRLAGRLFRLAGLLLLGTPPDPANCACACHPLPFLLRCYRCLVCP